MESLKCGGFTAKEAQPPGQQPASSFIIIVNISHVNLLVCAHCYSSLQYWLQQMSPPTLWEIRQRKRTGSTWTPVSFATRTANSSASLCLRRKCHGRYFTQISTTKPPAAVGPHNIRSRLFSCPLFSGQLHLIHAGLLRLWRRWGPCRWVCFYQERTTHDVLFLLGLVCVCVCIYVQLRQVIMGVFVNKTKDFSI